MKLRHKIITLLPACLLVAAVNVFALESTSNSNNCTFTVTYQKSGASKAPPIYFYVFAGPKNAQSQNGVSPSGQATNPNLTPVGGVQINYGDSKSISAPCGSSITNALVVNDTSIVRGSSKFCMAGSYGSGGSFSYPYNSDPSDKSWKQLDGNMCGATPVGPNPQNMSAV